MANNCLKTQLKASVQNDNLPIYNEILLEAKSDGILNLDSDTPIKVYSKNGTFTYNGSTAASFDIPNNANPIITVPAGVVVHLVGKYNIKKWRSVIDNIYGFEKFVGSTINELQTNSKGNFSVLSGTPNLNILDLRANAADLEGEFSKIPTLTEIHIWCDDRDQVPYKFSLSDIGKLKNLTTCSAPKELNGSIEDLLTAASGRLSGQLSIPYANESNITYQGNRVTSVYITIVWENGVPTVTFF